MENICSSPSKKQTGSAEVDDSHDWCGMNSQQKLSLSRALRNVDPDTKQLCQCISATARKIIDKQNQGRVTTEISELLTDCDCSEDSSDLNSSFWNLFKSKRYTEEELQRFVDVIHGRLNEELDKRITSHVKCKVCAKNRDAEYCIVRVIVGDSSSDDSSRYIPSLYKSLTQHTDFSTDRKYFEQTRAASMSRETNSAPAAIRNPSPCHVASENWRRENVNREANRSSSGTTETCWKSRRILSSFRQNPSESTTSASPRRSASGASFSIWLIECWWRGI